VTTPLSDADTRHLADAIAERIRYLVIREELDLLTVADVVDLLQRSERWVLNELRAKRLRGAKVGGSWIIKAADLDTYIESRTNLARIRRRR